MRPEYVTCHTCGRKYPLRWEGWHGERGRAAWSPDELDVFQQAQERHEQDCRR